MVTVCPVTGSAWDNILFRKWLPWQAFPNNQRPFPPTSLCSLTAKTRGELSIMAIVDQRWELKVHEFVSRIALHEIKIKIITECME